MGISERISQFDEAEEEKKKTWMEINRTQIQELDHPLNQGSESIWNQYFKVPFLFNFYFLIFFFSLLLFLHFWKVSVGFFINDFFSYFPGC